MVIELSMDIMRPVRSESMVSYGCHQPVLAAERSVNFNAVLMIGLKIVRTIVFSIVNLLTSPLIMYSKFIWSNLVWSVKVHRKISVDWSLS